LVVPVFLHGYAQTTYLPINTEDQQLLDRLETRSGRLSDSLFLTAEPVMRNRAVDFLLKIKSDTASTRHPASLSLIDNYSIAQMISENGEWVPGEDGAIDSKRPWFHAFYKKQYDLVHVKTDNFFLVINPIFNGEVIYEKSEPANPVHNPLISNSHGVEARGWIMKKIGFYTCFTDNQEMPPSFVNNYIINTAHPAVPGADFFTSSKPGHYDYFLASGYFDFAAIKNHLNITMGTGKHFIGDGIRSLFISDFSSNTPFLRLTARIWKMNYDVLYLEFTPQFNDTLLLALNYQLPHKYSTIHNLGYNATRWLNLGFFESSVFAKLNTFDISYLNPIILYKAVERFNGNPDKEIIGFNYKAIAAHHFQFYGQFILNEFKSSEFFSTRGWFGNKWGLQMGAKYFDAFNIPNLYLQGELNMVRPYTYTAHNDTIANYTNYNQTIADPLGSGFIEMIGVARYQPAKNWYVSAKSMYYMQGLDSNNTNYGNDIFNPYATTATTYGVKMINGLKANCALLNLTVSYKVFPNCYIDIGGTHRRYINESGIIGASSTTGISQGNSSTTYFYFGVRLNAPRRDYDFY